MGLADDCQMMMPNLGCSQGTYMLNNAFTTAGAFIGLRVLYEVLCLLLKGGY